MGLSEITVTVGVHEWVIRLCCNFLRALLHLGCFAIMLL
jgi:hypothetical protein